MIEKKAVIFDIQRNSFVDGPGIRTTVFFKGCNLRCAWCHNPEGQRKEPQLLFYKNKCTKCGRCKQECPNSLEACDLCGRCVLSCPSDARQICGREYTVREVMREILKDRVFYEASGGGVTFSGGECMLQIDFLEAVLKECKQNGIHIAVDTAGHVPYDSIARILPYTDLFLYDVKCIDAKKHKRYTGVGNELILENLKKLLQAKAPVWVRIPVVSSVNDTEEEMRKIFQFLQANGYPQKVELLAYHAMGAHKYAAIGREADEFGLPSEASMELFKSIFS